MGKLVEGLGVIKSMERIEAPNGECVYDRVLEMNGKSVYDERSITVTGYWPDEIKYIATDYVKSSDGGEMIELGHREFDLSNIVRSD